jgi:hypothetical protein
MPATLPEISAAISMLVLGRDPRVPSSQACQRIHRHLRSEERRARSVGRTKPTEDLSAHRRVSSEADENGYRLGASYIRHLAIPRSVCVPAFLGIRQRMTDPMYSTDPDGEEGGNQPEAGDFQEDQEPADRSPTPGNAPAPGQRPSESGSTPSDIPTEADEDAHRDHAGRRRQDDEDD